MDPARFAEMVRVWLSVNLKRHGVDCGGTVGRIGPWTRADGSRTRPHLGHNLDTGANPFNVVRGAHGKVSGYTRCRPARPGPQTISRNRREVSTLSHNRVDATVLRSAVASIGTIRRATLLLVVTIMFALVGCSESTRPSTTTMATATATTRPPAQPRLASDPAQWRLASDPARLAEDLVAAGHVLPDPSSSEAVLRAVARRQQAAYYALGRHPEWDPTARSRI